MTVATKRNELINELTFAHGRREIEIRAELHLLNDCDPFSQYDEPSGSIVQAIIDGTKYLCDMLVSLLNEEKKK